MRAKPITLFFAAALVSTACRHSRSATADFYPGPVGRPFSTGVRVGNMLYLSGQIGTDADGKLVGGGITTETRQTMTNIAVVLQQHGTSMERVVKCTAMLADMREWDAMNTVYVAFFPTHKPARSAFGASGLALGARVEIECMAMVDE